MSQAKGIRNLDRPTRTLARAHHLAPAAPSGPDHDLDLYSLSRLCLGGPGPSLYLILPTPSPRLCLFWACLSLPF